MTVERAVSMQGIGVCPGRAAGPVALMGARPRLPAERPTVADPDAEADAALAALSLTAEDLDDGRPRPPSRVPRTSSRRPP